MKRKTAQGFTLVELLVVIAIIAILAAVIVLIINPLELTRRGRDATRLSDLANLQQAINVYVQESTSSGTSVLCFNGTDNGSNHVDSNYCGGRSSDNNGQNRSNNGSGWIPVNLSAQTSVQVPTLPVDPTNSAGADGVESGATEGLHYAYCSDGTSYEIAAILESQQQAGKMGTDGGPDNNLYEVGSKLGLIGGSSACKY